VIRVLADVSSAYQAVFRSSHPRVAVPRTTSTVCSPIWGAGGYRNPGLVQVADALGPVLREGGLQPGNRRPTHADVRVAPFLGVPRVPRPLLGDADTTGEPHLAVDHEHLAVRPVVVRQRGAHQGRPEELHRHARCTHPIGQPVIHPRATNGVDEHPDSAPGPRPIGQRRGKRFRRPSGPVDVREQVDGPRRRSDRCQHRREDLHTVAQHLNLVALCGGDTQQGLEATA
jgi:hypothetical protein